MRIMRCALCRLGMHRREFKLEAIPAKGSVFVTTLTRCRRHDCRMAEWSVIYCTEVVHQARHLRVIR